VLVRDVTAGHRVLVGTGAVAREGVRLGDDLCIGPGAVVIADVVAGLTVVGVPARVSWSTVAGLPCSFSEANVT
jgi:serine acetyltransferase